MALNLACHLAPGSHEANVSVGATRAQLWLRLNDHDAALNYDICAVCQKILFQKLLASGRGRAEAALWRAAKAESRRHSRLETALLSRVFRQVKYMQSGLPKPCARTVHSGGKPHAVHTLARAHGTPN